MEDKQEFLTMSSLRFPLLFAGSRHPLVMFFLLLLACMLPVTVSADTGVAGQPAVKKFINEMVHTHHFSKKTLIDLFNQAEIRPSAIQSIREPLEKKPWALYRVLFVTDWRVKKGLEFWEKNRTSLEKAEKIYGIPPDLIVATIGIEAKYGKELGKYRIIDSLSTLAFSGSSRALFFRRQLEAFLLLTREHHLDPLALMGSYAGAMGQAQFTPDSYRRYAVSFTPNKWPDLYHDDADIIASIANYYHAHGWRSHQPVASPVDSRPQDSAPALQTARLKKPGEKPRLIQLSDTLRDEYWLAFHNFEVIRHYNNSDLYAMAVLHLSQKMIQQEKNHHGHTA